MADEQVPKWEGEFRILALDDGGRCRRQPIAEQNLPASWLSTCSSDTLVALYLPHDAKLVFGLLGRAAE